jgi:hypothetical protein
MKQGPGLPQLRRNDAHISSRMEPLRMTAVDPQAAGRFHDQKFASTKVRKLSDSVENCRRKAHFHPGDACQGKNFWISDLCFMFLSQRIQEEPFVAA